jgi:hypothetical protein
MSVESLSIKILPSPIHGERARRIEIEVRANSKYYSLSEIVYDNDLARFFDLIFDRARDEIRQHILTEVAKS